jgi:hypothetical protein
VCQDSACTQPIGFTVGALRSASSVLPCRPACLDREERPYRVVMTGAIIEPDKKAAHWPARASPSTDPGAEDSVADLGRDPQRCCTQQRPVRSKVWACGPGRWGEPLPPRRRTKSSMSTQRFTSCSIWWCASTAYQKLDVHNRAMTHSVRAGHRWCALNCRAAPQGLRSLMTGRAGCTIAPPLMRHRWGPYFHAISHSREQI